MAKTFRGIETKEDAKNESNNKLLSAEDTQSLRYMYVRTYIGTKQKVSNTLQVSTGPNRSGSAEVFLRDKKSHIVYV